MQKVFIFLFEYEVISLLGRGCLGQVEGQDIGQGHSLSRQTHFDLSQMDEVGKLEKTNLTKLQSNSIVVHVVSASCRQDEKEYNTWKIFAEKRLKLLCNFLLRFNIAQRYLSLMKKSPYLFVHLQKNYLFLHFLEKNYIESMIRNSTQ